MGLSAARVKSIKPETKLRRYADGGGLYLVVKPSGAKQFVGRLTVNGRRRDIGLGGYPAVTLAQARERLAANRHDIADGVDPIAQRRKVVPTLREASESIIQLNRSKWGKENTERVWRGRLEGYVFPALGDVPVDRIRVPDVLAILEPLWTTKAETGRRVRYILRQVFAWTIAHEYRPDNPAGEAIDGALVRQPQVKAHHRSLPYYDVEEALNILEGSNSGLSAKACFRFLVLTACRSGEARGARWDEIDLDGAVWTIPASRMKMGVEHRVPLSTQAVVVLARAWELRDGSGLIFPSPVKQGATLSDMALIKQCRDNDLACTPHGFRSSFRTWALEQTDTPWAVAEAALAHRLGDSVEAAYVRGDLFERRRALMQAWGDYLIHE